MKNYEMINTDRHLTEPTFTLETKKGDKCIFHERSEQQVLTCYHPETRTLFAVVASEDFALLYKIKDWTGGKVNKPIAFCQVLTIKKAQRIAVINSDQVAIYSYLSLVVVNHNKQKPEREKSLKN